MPSIPSCPALASAYWYPFAIDLIRETIARLACCHTASGVLDALQHALGSLFPPAHVGICLLQDDACFDLLCSHPATAQPQLSRLTDALIESGHFARALRNIPGRAVFLPDAGGLLQALATPRQIYGMVLIVHSPLADEHMGALGVLLDLAAMQLERFDPETKTCSEPHDLVPQSMGSPTTRDRLTGLTDRIQFIHFLHAATATSKSDKPVAVLILHLDALHRINQEFGHELGDQLLRDIALRIETVAHSHFLHETLGISEFDICIARIGSNEFGIVLSQIARSHKLTDTIAYLQNHLSEGFRENHSNLYPSISIGAALCTDERTPVLELLRNADTALKHAAEGGRNQFAVYRSAWEDSASLHVQAESMLHEALRKNHFKLHYQPLIKLGEHRLIGAEALLRMPGTDGPLSHPGYFIPLAERTGQIVEISEWVLRMICRQLRRWTAIIPSPFHVSYNLSAIDLHRLDLVPQLRRILLEEKIPPRLIHIEITETTVARDEQRAIDNIRALKHAGFEVWLDDFGTGFASLKLIKQFPLSGIKLDREFIKDLTQSDTEDAIAESVLEITRKMRLPVIAEGIETEAQHRFLLRHGCDFGQGYYLGRPVSPDKFDAQLARVKAKRDPGSV